MSSIMLRFLLPVLPVISLSSGLVNAENDATTQVDIAWYPPASTQINSLSTVINGTDIYGFIFNSSQDPAGVPFSNYNWCNMPHVRRQEYVIPPKQYKLEYVEVIHRHHKRTPYAANTFPVEGYPWYCNDSALYFYGSTYGVSGENTSASTFWSVSTDDANPLTAPGFPGNCEFPQITKEGLDDSWQHGKDLYGVYHDLLGLLPSAAPAEPATNNAAAFASAPVTFRVTNNVITSQVAGMVINGMFGTTSPYPVLIQPDAIDSLEPAYTCNPASSLYSAYGVGSTNPAWTAHLNDSQPLYAQLDAISGVTPNASDWHVSWDHYFDNLSARLCHQKPLPCNITNPALCITQAQADEVFRLGEYEYSFIYRDAGPDTLQASVGSFGIWVAELAEHLLDASAGNGTGTVYRHNVAHDGSISRLLSILQIQQMVWPGMGSEVVFELYSTENQKYARGYPGGGTHGKEGKEWFVRILWGGQVLHSSSPTIGVADMLPLNTLLAYFNALVGRRASLIPGKCVASS